MDFEPDIQKEDNTNKFIDVTQQELDLNAEIARKEYERLTFASRWKPFSKKPANFSYFLNNKISSKMIIPFGILSFLITWVALFFIFIALNLTSGFIFIFLLDLFIAPVVFILLNLGFHKFIGIPNTFEKLGISLKNPQEKEKVLSIFSIFLNNNWKGHLWLKEERQKIFDDVNEAIENGKSDVVLSIFNKIILNYYSDEFFKSRSGYGSKEELLFLLNKNPKSQNIQSSLLGVENTNTGSLEKDKDFIANLYSQKIEQEKIDKFTENLLASYQKKYGFLTVNMLDEDPKDVADMKTILGLMTLFLLLLASIVGYGLLASVVVLLLFVKFALKDVIKWLHNKSSEKLNKSDFDFEDKDSENIALGLGALSLLQRSTLGKSLFTEQTNKEQLNRYLSLYFAENNREKSSASLDISDVAISIVTETIADPVNVTESDNEDLSVKSFFFKILKELNLQKEKMEKDGKLKKLSDDTFNQSRQIKPVEHKSMSNSEAEIRRNLLLGDKE